MIQVLTASYSYCIAGKFQGLLFLKLIFEVMHLHINSFYIKLTTIIIAPHIDCDVAM